MAEPPPNDQPDETREMRKVRLASIGPYPIQAMIGEGGMGTVYRCFDPHLRRTVAIKVLSEERLRDAESRERFIREAQAIARLSHPNVVQIYAIDPGEDAGSPYFVMELVSGPSGDDRLRKGPPFTPESAARAVLDAARGLREAHRRGLIHRDIKPSNILFDEAGTAKIADFGLVKEVRAEPDRTDDGIILGTPHYISPEQGQGLEVDHRSDIYSLGATLFHMLAGAPPFAQETQVSTIVAHVTSPLPPLRELNPAVPQALAAIVERMLAKDPADRYASYDELIRDLETFLGARGRRPRALIGGLLGAGAIAAGALLAYGLTRILAPDPLTGFPPGTVARAQEGDTIFRNEFRNGLREIETFWDINSPGEVVASDDGHGRLVVEGRALGEGDRASASLLGLPLLGVRRIELLGIELDPYCHLAIVFGRRDAPSRTFSIRLRDGVRNEGGEIVSIERNGESRPILPAGGPCAFFMETGETYDLAAELSPAPAGGRSIRLRLLRRIRGEESARELEATYELPSLPGDDWGSGALGVLVDRYTAPFQLVLDDVVFVGRLDVERWRALRARGVSAAYDG
ncbi:MAG: serine/threonine protein kinase [Planctomycetes bacterium]|nr:serine/threonine protein kinase [Planctomycetota bacterium]